MFQLRRLEFLGVAVLNDSEEQFISKQDAESVSHGVADLGELPQDCAPASALRADVEAGVGGGVGVVVEVRVEGVVEDDPVIEGPAAQPVLNRGNDLEVVREIVRRHAVWGTASQVPRVGYVLFHAPALRVTHVVVPERSLDGQVAQLVRVVGANEEFKELEPL